MMNTKFLLFLGFTIVVAFAASHQEEFKNDSLDMEDYDDHHDDNDEIPEDLLMGDSELIFQFYLIFILNKLSQKKII